MKELFKTIATKFFYHWYNSPGNNTGEGFDKWWDTEGSKMIKPVKLESHNGLGDTFIDWKTQSPEQQWRRIDSMLEEKGLIVIDKPLKQTIMNNTIITALVVGILFGIMGVLMGTKISHGEYRKEALRSDSLQMVINYLIEIEEKYPFAQGISEDGQVIFQTKHQPTPESTWAGIALVPNGTVFYKQNNGRGTVNTLFINAKPNAIVVLNGDTIR